MRPALILAVRRRLARVARVTLYVPIATMLVLLVASALAFGLGEALTLILAFMVVAWLIVSPMFFGALIVLAKISLYVTALEERYPWVRVVSVPLAIIIIAIAGSESAAEGAGSFGGAGSSGDVSDSD